MTLLSINIPTYERLESFSAVLSKLAEEVGNLNADIKDLVRINVIDNDSSCSMFKKKLCEELEKKFTIRIKFRKNEKNFGGPINVHNAHCASPHANFTWVLGDDDHVIDGSLNYITSVLLTHKNELGLLILSDKYYRIHADLVIQRGFVSYCELARASTRLQPHFLIAHSLISCNVFRSNVFVESESLYAMNDLYVRYGHWTGISHMRGLLSGLFRSNYSVIVADQVVLDTGRRESDVDFGVQILDIYYFHFLWLLTEIGVRIDQIKRDNSMYWLYRGAGYNLMLWRQKIKPKEKLRNLLVALLGKKIFQTLRQVFEKK